MTSRNLRAFSSILPKELVVFLDVLVHCVQPSKTFVRRHSLSFSYEIIDVLLALVLFLIGPNINVALGDNLVQ
jgi:hypothetical protein